MLDQTFFGGFFPHLEADEAGSTAFYDPLWTTDPHGWSYNVEAPSYFPDYFMRVGWQVAPEPETPEGPSRGGGKGRHIYHGWQGWRDRKPEPKPRQLAKAVAHALKKKEWIAPGVFINSGALDSLPSRAIVSLLEAIQGVYLGLPLPQVAMDCAERLQAILSDEEEALVIMLLLMEDE